MRQKFILEKDETAGHFIIKEFGELDKEIFSLVCEETYPLAALSETARKRRESLVSMLRTPNLFPPRHQMEALSVSILEFLENGSFEPVEVNFDDMDHLAREAREAVDLDDLEDDGVEIDDLIDDDIDDDYEEKGDIGSINAPLKVAEDDSLDIDEEN